MAKQKQVKAFVKLQLPAGKATPAPPVGPALGQHGVGIMDFCKAYNDATKDKVGMIIPVEITIFADRTFTFILKTPPVSELIKEEAGIKKGSPVPNRDKVGTKLTRAQLEKIASVKMPDLNAASMDAAVRIVEGSARSMGVEVLHG